MAEPHVAVDQEASAGASCEAPCRLVDLAVGVAWAYLEASKAANLAFACLGDEKVAQVDHFS